MNNNRMLFLTWTAILIGIFGCGSQAETCNGLLMPGRTIRLTASSVRQVPGEFHGPTRAIFNANEFTDRSGRLLAGAWSAAPNDLDPYIQVELESPSVVRGVVTQGRNGCCQEWVTEYKVLYSNAHDCSTWQQVNVGNETTFDGNVDENTPFQNNFRCFTSIKCIRLVPVTWHNYPSLRFDLIGCPIRRARAAIPLAGAITTNPTPNLYSSSDCSGSLLSQHPVTMTASSAFAPHDPKHDYGAYRGILNTTEYTDGQGNVHIGGWVAEKNDLNQYLQVELSKPSIIRGVVTQGRSGCCQQWVSRFRIQYSVDCKTWSTVGNGSAKVFEGNRNENRPVTNIMDCPIAAKCIRIVPSLWHTHIAMRMDLLGCEIRPGGGPVTAGTTPPVTPSANTATISTETASTTSTKTSTTTTPPTTTATATTSTLKSATATKPTTTTTTVTTKTTTTTSTTERTDTAEKSPTTPPPTTAKVCADKPGVDCMIMDQIGVCNDALTAREYCPKFCGICSTSSSIIVGSLQNSSIAGTQQTHTSALMMVVSPLLSINQTLTASPSSSSKLATTTITVSPYKICQDKPGVDCKLLNTAGVCQNHNMALKYCPNLCGLCDSLLSSMTLSSVAVNSLSNQKNLHSMSSSQLNIMPSSNSASPLASSIASVLQTSFVTRSLVTPALQTIPLSTHQSSRSSFPSLSSSMAPTSVPPQTVCQDKHGLDCSVLNQIGVCHDPDLAPKYCPMYCGICLSTNLASPSILKSYQQQSTPSLSTSAAVLHISPITSSIISTKSTTSTTSLLSFTPSVPTPSLTASGLESSVSAFMSQTLASKASMETSSIVISSTISISSTCVDMQGVDCLVLEKSGVCHDTGLAQKYCPKYCGLCQVSSLSINRTSHPSLQQSVYLSSFTMASYVSISYSQENPVLNSKPISPTTNLQPSSLSLHTTSPQVSSVTPMSSMAGQSSSYLQVTCSDTQGVDCGVLAMAGVCTVPTLAHKYCSKYCRLCPYSQSLYTTETSSNLSQQPTLSQPATNMTTEPRMSLSPLSLYSAIMNTTPSLYLLSPSVHHIKTSLMSQIFSSTHVFLPGTTFSSLTSIIPSTTSSTVIPTSALMSSPLSCMDKPGVDCNLLNQIGVCQNANTAQTFCPKFCGLCQSLGIMATMSQITVSPMTSSQAPVTNVNAGPYTNIVFSVVSSPSPVSSSVSIQSPSTSVQSLIVPGQIISSQNFFISQAVTHIPLTGVSMKPSSSAQNIAPSSKPALQTAMQQINFSSILSTPKASSTSLAFLQLSTASSMPATLPQYSASQTPHIILPVSTLQFVSTMLASSTLNFHYLSSKMPTSPPQNSVIPLLQSSATLSTLMPNSSQHLSLSQSSNTPLSPLQPSVLLSNSPSTLSPLLSVSMSSNMLTITSQIFEYLSSRIISTSSYLLASQSVSMPTSSSSLPTSPFGNLPQTSTQPLTQLPEPPSTIMSSWSSQLSTSFALLSQLLASAYSSISENSSHLSISHLGTTSPFTSQLLTSSSSSMSLSLSQQLTPFYSSNPTLSPQPMLSSFRIVSTLTYIQSSSSYNSPPLSPQQVATPTHSSMSTLPIQPSTSLHSSLPRSFPRSSYQTGSVFLTALQLLPFQSNSVSTSSSWISATLSTTMPTSHLHQSSFPDNTKPSLSPQMTVSSVGSIATIVSQPSIPLSIFVSTSSPLLSASISSSILDSTPQLFSSLHIMMPKSSMQLSIFHSSVMPISSFQPSASMSSNIPPLSSNLSIRSLLLSVPLSSSWSTFSSQVSATVSGIMFPSIQGSIYHSSSIFMSSSLSKFAAQSSQLQSNNMALAQVMSSVISDISSNNPMFSPGSYNVISTTYQLSTSQVHASSIVMPSLSPTSSVISNSNLMSPLPLSLPLSINMHTTLTKVSTSLKRRSTLAYLPLVTVYSSNMSTIPTHRLTPQSSSSPLSSSQLSPIMFSNVLSTSYLSPSQSIITPMYTTSAQYASSYINTMAFTLPLYSVPMSVSSNIPTTTQLLPVSQYINMATSASLSPLSLIKTQTPTSTSSASQHINTSSIIAFSPLRASSVIPTVYLNSGSITLSSLMSSSPLSVTSQSSLTSFNKYIAASSLYQTQYASSRINTMAFTLPLSSLPMSVSSNIPTTTQLLQVSQYINMATSASLSPLSLIKTQTPTSTSSASQLINTSSIIAFSPLRASSVIPTVYLNSGSITLSSLMSSSPLSVTSQSSLTSFNKYIAASSVYPTSSTQLSPSPTIQSSFVSNASLFPSTIQVSSWSMFLSSRHTPFYITSTESFSTAFFFTSPRSVLTSSRMTPFAFTTQMFTSSVLLATPLGSVNGSSLVNTVVNKTPATSSNSLSLFSSVTPSSSNSLIVSVLPTVSQCEDTAPDCKILVPLGVCADPQLSHTICRKLCGNCPTTTTLAAITTTTATTTTTTTLAHCEDTSGFDCRTFDIYYSLCKNPALAKSNCPKYCNVCP